MTLKDFQGKQFRGARTRSGKLISNRIGAYEQTRLEDNSNCLTRRNLTERALACAERQDEEQLVLDMTEPVCQVAGASVPVGGGLVFQSIEVDEFGDFNEDLVAMRFSADGKISWAQHVTPEEAMALHRAFKN